MRVGFSPLSACAERGPNEAVLEATAGLIRGNRGFDCLCQVLRVKSKWARFAFVKYASTLTDQIEPVGPTRESRFDTIVETVNECGEFDAQLADARPSNIGALDLVLWTAEEYVIAHIGLHLPHVGGMRLEDVHGVKSDFTLILLGELVQGGNLPPKRRSGVTAEDQDDRLVGP